MRRATHFHLVLYLKLQLLISSCCWRPNEVFFYSYEICWLNQGLNLLRGQESARKVWEGRRGYNEWMGNSWMGNSKIGAMVRLGDRNALKRQQLWIEKKSLGRKKQESERKVWEGRRGLSLLSSESNLSCHDSRQLVIYFIQLQKVKPRWRTSVDAEPKAVVRSCFPCLKTQMSFHTAD